MTKYWWNSSFERKFWIDELELTAVYVQAETTIFRKFQKMKSKITNKMTVSYRASDDNVFIVKLLLFSIL